MDDHKGNFFSGVTLPLTVGRVCQAVLVCVSCVLCHPVVLGETRGDLGSPFDSPSVLCSHGVCSNSRCPLV